MGQYKMQISEKNGSILNAYQHGMQIKKSSAARVFFCPVAKSIGTAGVAYVSNGISVAV